MMKVGHFIIIIFSFIFIITNTLTLAQAVQTPLPGNMIQKYVDPLPHFAGARVDGTNPLTVSMHEFQQPVLPSTFVYPAQFTGTYVWGYKVGSAPALYPGFTIEAQRGTATAITYSNELPTAPFLQNYLIYDQTLHWANPDNLSMDDPARMNPFFGPPPTVVHLHGGEVPSEYDGGPDQWFTPDGIHGPGYRTASPVASYAAEYVYPNTQEATTLWFHDHTLGATRLNVYAGLAAFYFLRDWAKVRNDLPGGPNDVEVQEPLPGGGTKSYKPEIEIVIQDRMFDTNGQWFFPHIGDNPEHPFWIPEFLGDAIVVNGKTWPYLDVEPRRYRFRLLNGSNARFYNMWIENRVTATAGPIIWQIGTDGGMLDLPVPLTNLLIAPGERADIIIDFSGFAGQTLTIRNNARAPFPKGGTADPQTVGQIMQFRVGMAISDPSGADPSYDPATYGSLRTNNPIIWFNTAAPDVTRQLTLNEVMGLFGPLEALVNNSKWAGKRPDGTPLPGGYPDGQGNILTELPLVGSTEVWEVINLTGDAHPIHLHLVQFQLISRQKFNVNKYMKVYDAAFPTGVYIPDYGPPLDYFTANADGALGGNPAIGRYLQGIRPMNPNESGWKDTIIMYPGEVTRIAVRFAPQDLMTTVSGTNYFDFDPTSGPGYVWHCHIIDHEDNEMMRPYNLFTTPPIVPVLPQNTGPAEVASLELIPAKFVLEQNYPNPFNPTTQINFQLPEASVVHLTIYNTLGQEVRTLVNSNFEEGVHSVSWDATDNFGNRVTSGVYIYRIEAGNFMQHKKMVLLK